MKIDWKVIKKPENIPYVIIILIASFVAILGLIGVVEVQTLTAAVLLVLVSIAWLLIILHSSIREFQKQWKSPNIGEILKPFQEMEGEIRSKIGTADEIWLLSRTGRGWWNNFNDEFKKVPKARFLFLDPDNAALEMVVKSALEPWDNFEYNPNALWAMKDQAIRFLNYLKSNTGDKIDLKVIDHLPAWTLLIANPNKTTKESIIYVELAPYHASPTKRPVFKVTLQDIEYFILFKKDEFERMWEKARPWAKEKKEDKVEEV